MEISVDFLKKTENRATRTLRSILLLVVYLKQPKLKYHGNTCTSMFTDTWFIVVKIQTQCYGSINRLKNKENKAHIYDGILISQKEKWNHDMWRNMDKTGKYYVRLKPDWERQVLHVSSLYFCVSTCTSIYIQLYMSVCRLWDRKRIMKIEEKI